MFASLGAAVLCSNGMHSALPRGQDTEDGQCSVFPTMPLVASPHTNGKVLPIQSRPCALRFQFLCIAEEALPKKHLCDEMKARSALMGASTEPLFILSRNRTYGA
jgi:hypothetical protein